MTFATAVGWGLAAVMAGAAGRQAYRLNSPGRPVRAAHLLMCAGMAAMFAPVGWSIPRLAGVVVYLAAAVWCLVARGPHRLHAVTGSVAMAYMFVIPGMGHLGGMAGMAMGPGGAYGWISLALAAYFAGETVSAFRVLLTARRGPAADAACHMAVAIAMGYMLLTLG
ncbi:DUF5134 domain-containing protein [Actinoallomurus acaciae]|uniref:DUF5134 domain-containing protein n=1 Tax=Actinoallomurus acaciae TaxID=502577 RepID=A0ABV5YZE1_9ACTN